jgi:hypothetical protein
MLAKYLIFAHYFLEQLQTKFHTTLAWSNPVVLAGFLHYLPKLFSPFDLLWIFLALSVTVKLLRPVNVSFKAPEQVTT